METDTQDSPDWRTATPLRRLDPRRSLSLRLVGWRTPVAFWWLEQAGQPVAIIERGTGAGKLRTTSDEWRVEVRRRPRRLGWHLEFRRADGSGPALQYLPGALLQGGRLELVSSRRYRLRCPLLHNDWKLEAMPGGEIGRFGPPRGDARMHVTLTNRAAHEPFLALRDPGRH